MSKKEDKKEEKKEDKKEEKKEDFEFNFGNNKSDKVEFNFGTKNEFDFGTNEFNFEPKKKGEDDEEVEELEERLNTLHLKELNEEQLKKVEELKKIQADITELNKKFDEEFIQLELKYEKLRAPLILDRTKVVNAKTEEGKFAGVPNFWENVIKNSELAGDLVQPHDYDSLKYMEDISIVVNDEPKGYTIVFHYGDNPYFTNKTLTKQYIEKDGEVAECKGTKIEWKDQEKDLTKKVVYKKKKHKGGGKPKKVKTFEEQESFYQFFKDMEGEVEEGSEEAFVRESLLNSDVEIGGTIRDSIIPNAVDYYLGEVEIEAPMMGGDYGEDGEDDEDDLD